MGSYVPNTKEQRQEMLKEINVINFSKKQKS